MISSPVHWRFRYPVSLNWPPQTCHAATVDWRAPDTTAPASTRVAVSPTGLAIAVLNFHVALFSRVARAIAAGFAEIGAALAVEVKATAARNSVERIILGP